MVHRSCWYASLLLLLSSAATVSSSLNIHVADREPGAIVDLIGRLPSWVSNELPEIVIAQSTSSQLAQGHARLTSTPEGDAQIVGASAVDALYAVNAYLRDYCSSMVTWDAAHFGTACRRPEFVNKEYKAPKIRFFGSRAIFSLSFTWWKWPEWERFIDWLALNGFNMVLAPLGQEAIWRKVWTDLGVAEESLSDFFTNPAFSAWSEKAPGLGGGASAEYFDGQLELNKRIVARMNALGIVPVLPTFTGAVPAEFERRNPNLKFRKLACLPGQKGSSCGVALSPADAKFKQIAEAFIKKQKEIYGSSATHVYYAAPSETGDEEELADLSKAISEGCRAGDKDCIWVLPSSVFADWTAESAVAFLGAVPAGRLLVLDEQSERRSLHRVTNQFAGHPWIWCLQHNTGGSLQLRGSLKNVNEEYFNAVHSSSKPLGAGITTEAIGQNYAVYQFAVDRFWNGVEKMSSFKWASSYASARYGTAAAAKTWKTMLMTLYNEPKNGEAPTSDSDDYDSISEVADGVVDAHEVKFLYQTPKLGGRFRYWFPTRRLQQLVDEFTALNETLGGNELFRKDLTDVLREKQEYDIINGPMLRIYEGYAVSDSSILREGCSGLENGFEKLDLVAAPTLSSWLRSARDAAASADEGNSFEAAARSQIALFGGRNGVRDYAAKEWGGMIRKLYAKRWELFCEHLLNEIKGLGKFTQASFEAALAEKVDGPFAAL